MKSERIYFHGIYYRVGDIVGIRDKDDGKMYYAQIRGFLNSQYSEKSAIITWLLPSISSPEVDFDPSTYFLGPEEDIPRKLECMEFICSAPSDYYYNCYSPYPTLSTKPEIGFVWKSPDNGDICNVKECQKLSTSPTYGEKKTEPPDEGINIDSDEEQNKEINNFKTTNISDVD